MFRASEIEAIRTPELWPIGHAFGGPFVRTTREDTPDHLLVYSRRHLQSVLAAFLRHYKEARLHRGRQLATPLPRQDQPSTGEIRRRDILGGIVHEYDRAA